jgi:hypothetical protein
MSAIVAVIAAAASLGMSTKPSVKSEVAVGAH